MFLILITSCVLNSKFLPSSSDEEKADKYRELMVGYYTDFFEKSTRINFSELHSLEKKTREALQNNGIGEKHIDVVKRWHHKLKSYLSFVHIDRENLTDDNGVIKESLSVLILNRLRNQPSRQIDLDESNEDFFQKVIAEKINTTNVSDFEKQFFFKKLIAKNISMTEKSTRKYRRLFPFTKTSFLSLCLKKNHPGCSQLVAEEAKDKFQEEPFADAKEVTELVNKFINNLNKIITLLSKFHVTKKTFFIFNETDFEDKNVILLYTQYEMILAQAAQRGVLPVFFAESFRKKSGNIYLNNWGGLKEVKHLPLTAVTQKTIEESILEMKQEILKRWIELKKLATEEKEVSEKTIYKWVINSEISVAQLILQNPKHAIVTVFLLNKFQHEARDPKLLRVIRRIIETTEIAAVVVIFGGMALGSIFPAFSAFSVATGLTGKAIIVATAANFGWVGTSSVRAAITQNRYLMLERSLLTGTSQRISDNMELLREFRNTRKNAIISGTIGLGFSIPAMKYVMKHMYDGKRIFVIDIIGGIFANMDEYGREDKSDADLMKSF